MPRISSLDALAGASLPLYVALCLSTSACSVAPASPEEEEPRSDPELLERECVEDAREWTAKLDAFCGTLDLFPRPSYLNPPSDPSAPALRSDAFVLEISAEGVRAGDGWAIDPARVAGQLDEVAAARAGETRYALAADARTPTSFALDVMRRMHAKGFTRVDLVATTESSASQTFSAGSLAAVSALQEVVSVEDRKAQALERVAATVGGSCEPMITLYQAISVLEPRSRCDAMASSMPAAFQGCGCDADIDFVAASLMLPFQDSVVGDVLGAHAYTISPGGDALELDPEDTWNKSFFVFVSGEREIAPPW